MFISTLIYFLVIYSFPLNAFSDSPFLPPSPPPTIPYLFCLLSFFFSTSLLFFLFLLDTLITFIFIKLLWRGENTISSLRFSQWRISSNESILYNVFTLKKISWSMKEWLRPNANFLFKAASSVYIMLGKLTLFSPDSSQVWGPSLLLCSVKILVTVFHGSVSSGNLKIHVQSVSVA